MQRQYVEHNIIPADSDEYICNDPFGAYGYTFDEIMDAFDFRHKLLISRDAEMIYQVFGRLIDIVREHEENSPKPLITTSTAIFSQVRYRLQLESSLRRISMSDINIVIKFELLRYPLASPKFGIRPYPVTKIVMESAVIIYKCFHVNFFFL